jgi:hypothetical protein
MQPGYVGLAPTKKTLTVQAPQVSQAGLFTFHFSRFVFSLDDLKYVQEKRSQTRVHDPSHQIK